MIFRLSQKLSMKLGEAPTRVLPLDQNPLADWSGHLFLADRTQYIIVTNTASLYSALLYGRGVVDGGRLIERGLAAIRDVLVDDGLGFIYLRSVAPSAASVSFSKSLNRSVTGSMNDLINCAKMWLLDEDLSPYDASFKLNEMPMSAIKYANPRDALMSLSAGTPEST
ncbi:DUF6933 domain-containing protein [Lacipirellula limnantheis]|uniref:DUF6933 domain-containing protein n=1 Tax=Lacipirellula limnantheis TaxID=2528024 RepID=A0A517TZ30_9BACT|nr:hypothetical protein [Lacipirellula limnantheis]QDT73627.1 hypothetical protein I41_28160 [Lacipirellula limnantheis]